MRMPRLAYLHDCCLCLAATLPSPVAGKQGDMQVADLQLDMVQECAMLDATCCWQHLHGQFCCMSSSQTTGWLSMKAAD